MGAKRREGHEACGGGRSLGLPWAQIPGPPAVSQSLPAPPPDMASRRPAAHTRNLQGSGGWPKATQEVQECKTSRGMAPAVPLLCPTGRWFLSPFPPQPPLLCSHGFLSLCESTCTPAPLRFLSASISASIFLSLSLHVSLLCDNLQSRLIPFPAIRSDSLPRDSIG